MYVHMTESLFRKMNYSPFQASGLDKHMLNSPRPLKYTHLDIQGASGKKSPGPATASSLVAVVLNALGY